MKLSALTRSLRGAKTSGNSDLEISSVIDDSRKAREGCLFVAIKGMHIDAHDKIPEAVRNGAVAVVGQRRIADVSLGKGTTYVQVSNSREALAYISSAWYGYPTKKLCVIGVTGTDGKTTTASMIHFLLEKSGAKSGLITTVNAKIGDKVYDTGFHVSNPEPLKLYKFLSQMAEYGCSHVVIEVTSHGLDQRRVAAIDFNIAVLTNVAREHLDYHKTFESYRAAKARLFKDVPLSVINKDDKSYEYFHSKTKKGSKVVSYGLQEEADYCATEVDDVSGGLKYTLNHLNKKWKVEMKNVIGDYNVSNSLAAISCINSLGIGIDAAIAYIADFSLPKGRLERTKNKKGINIFIDYAHTPQGLRSVLTVLKKMTKGKLVVVTGCEGERDRQKRPLMGKISARIADVSIFSEMDPRSERVEDILKTMSSGALESGAKELIQDDNVQNQKGHVFLEIPDRAEAIYFAINKIAVQGDTVVLCGKGHETGMDYGDHEAPWSDHEVVKLALAGEVYTKHR